MQRDGNDSCGMRAREVDKQNGGFGAQRARRSSAGSDCPSCSTDRSEQDGPSLTNNTQYVEPCRRPCGCDDEYSSIPQARYAIFLAGKDVFVG